MNKILLVLGTILALNSTAAFAQRKGISIGIEGGPNRSSFWGNDFVKQYKTRGTNFSADILLEYKLTELLSLRPGLSYERKGVKIKGQMVDEYGNERGTATTRSNYDYLLLPLLVKASLGEKPVFFVNAGPYVGYLLKHTEVSEDHELLPGRSTSSREGLKRVDMGISAGFGAGLPVSENILMTLEIRHNLGLYNISTAPVYNDGEVRTRSTNLLIGVAYKIKD